MLNLKPAALAAGLALFAVSATAQDMTADTVLATVNGADITLGHVIATRMALPDQYQALPDEVLLDGILEQLIQQSVLSQAMGELSRRTEIQLENERRALIAGEKIDAVLAEAVTDEALQAAYDQAYADAEPTKEYKASHILVETEEEAADLITQLEEGADFAELAKEHSTGPSGPNGGDLGWFSAGMMVEPFENAVMALEVGQVSPPVQTQFGWHVVTLNEIRDQGPPALEDVREELAAQIENDAIEAAVAALVDSADISRTDLTTIDPSVLRQDDLIE